MFDSTDTKNKVRCYLQHSKELIADILNKGYQEPLLINFLVQWVSRVAEVSTREFSSDPPFEYLQRILNRQLALPSTDEKSEESQSAKDNAMLITVFHHQFFVATIRSTNWQKTYLNQIISGKGQAIIDALLYFAQCSCQEFSVYQESHVLNSIRTLMENLVRDVMISQHPKIFANNWSLFVSTWFKTNGGWGKPVELTFVSNLLKKLLTSVQDLTSNESACYATLNLYSIVLQLWNNLSHAFRLVFTDDLHKWVKVFVQMLRQIEHENTFSNHTTVINFNVAVIWIPLSPQPGQFPYLILAEAVETGQKTWVNLAWKLFCKDSYKSILSLYDANETAG
ncbi:hypothetical protein RFI_39749, partial [Reticulomyxa filosa]